MYYALFFLGTSNISKYTTLWKYFFFAKSIKNAHLHKNVDIEPLRKWIYHGPEALDTLRPFFNKRNLEKKTRSKKLTKKLFGEIVPQILFRCFCVAISPIWREKPVGKILAQMSASLFWNETVSILAPEIAKMNFSNPCSQNCNYPHIKTHAD